jgi:hypothetical protein
LRLFTAQVVVASGYIIEKDCLYQVLAATEA